MTQTGTGIQYNVNRFKGINMNEFLNACVQKCNDIDIVDAVNLAAKMFNWKSNCISNNTIKYTSILYNIGVCLVVSFVRQITTASVTA